MSEINERFILLLKEKYSNNVSEFARRSGIPQPTLNNIVGNRMSKPSFESIEKLINSDETINSEWLITGKGEKYKKNISDVTKLHNPPYRESLNENVTVPLYNVEAAANLSMILENNKENVVSYISLPNMPTVDGAVAVRGDSMYPIIKSGDIVVFKWVSSPEYITFGEIYLVSYTWDDDVHVTVKYVKRSETPEYVKLVSYNTHHEPLDVPIASIQSIAIVKVSIRYNTIS